MSSYNPPIYWFSGIGFDSAYFSNTTLPVVSSGGGLTQAQADTYYLRKTTTDTDPYLATFSNGLAAASVTTNTVECSSGDFNLNTSQLGNLNVGTAANKLGSIHIGDGLGSSGTLYIGCSTTPMQLNTSTLDATVSTSSGGVAYHTLNTYPMSYSGGNVIYSFTGNSSVQLPDSLINCCTVSLAGTMTATPTLFLPLNPYNGQIVTIVDKTSGNFGINGGGTHLLNYMGGSQLSYTVGTGTYGTFQFDGNYWQVSNFFIGTGAGQGFRVASSVDVYGNGNIACTMFAQQSVAALTIGSNTSRSGAINISTTTGASNPLNLNTGSTGLVTLSSSTGLLSLPTLSSTTTNYWSYTATNGTQTFANNTAAVVLWQTTNIAGNTSLLTFASGVWANASGRTLFIQGSYNFALVGNALGSRVSAIYAGTSNVQYGTVGTPYVLTATNWVSTAGFTFTLPTGQSFSLNGFQSGVAGGLAVVSSATSGTSTNINFIAV